MHDPEHVIVGGPLQPFASGYITELRRLGYTASGATLQLRLLAYLSRWLETEGFEPEQLSAAGIDRFLEARRAAGHTRYTSAKALRPILDHLRRLAVFPRAPGLEPVDALHRLLDRYRRHLTIERGLAPTTIRGYEHALRPFLVGRATPDGLAFADLTAADVTAFVASHCPGQARGSARLTVTALRSLLGFLHLEAVLPRSLVSAVPRVGAWRLAGLPRTLTPDEVDRLLAACDRRRATGRRDFAIVTLLVRLGLRAGEVARLGLDDIDWRAGEFVVRGKGDRAERLPLPADVGEALVGYLRAGRPSSALDRALFVRAKAPHRALTSAGVSAVVGTAARRAGLGTVHAHRLRHTAATGMLRAGGSLAEIGQVLRHRRALTTAIYAKVDTAALRAIALPWPGGAA